MCMLSFFPDGVIPEQRRLENGADANPDGHGFAIVTRDRQILIQRSMDSEDLIERFMRLRRQHPEGPALFHSRIATSGLVDITGCHPFKVGRDNRTVVAHNGILFSPPAKSLLSDTALFARDILPNYRSLDRKRTMRRLEDYAGPANKFVILTVNPARRHNAYLINEDAGHWANGEWHSNYDYTGWSSKYYGSTKSYRYDWECSEDGQFTREAVEPWPCDLCGANYAVDKYTLVCSVCRSCNDCMAWVEDCQCFAPKSAEESARVFTSSLELQEYDRGDGMAVVERNETPAVLEPWPYKELPGRVAGKALELWPSDATLANS